MSATARAAVPEVDDRLDLAAAAAAVDVDVDADADADADANARGDDDPAPTRAAPSSADADPAGRRRPPVAVAKLAKRLHRLVGRAIADYAMIEPGDRVMVCVSGGKDSYALLDLLLALRARAPVPFELIAVNLDQRQPGFPAHVLPDYLARRGVPYHVETRDTYSVVKRLVPEGRTMCSLCSRLRRGILYRVAGELGCTKVALGHHRDDMLQTFLMNMFFGARLKGMPAKLVSDDGRHVVIRPLAYVAETDLERWAAYRRFPLIPCTLCGSQENLQRVQARTLLRDWERRFPGRVENMASAMAHVVPSHLLDRRLHPFESLRATGVADPRGDRAFDEDDPCAPADTATVSVRSHAGGGDDDGDDSSDDGGYDGDDDNDNDNDDDNDNDNDDDDDDHGRHAAAGAEDDRTSG